MPIRNVFRNDSEQERAPGLPGQRAEIERYSHELGHWFAVLALQCSLVIWLPDMPPKPSPIRLYP